MRLVDPVQVAYGFRSPWPYVLGAICGPVFGVALLSLLVIQRGPLSLAHPSILGLFGGAAGLALAWAGVMSRGYGGAAAIAGCLAFPAGLLYLYVLRDWGYELAVSARLLYGATALWAWGHAIARGLGAFRAIPTVIAPIATVLFVLAALGDHHPVPDSVAAALMYVVIGGVGVAAVSLGAGFVSLSRRAGGAGATPSAA